MTAWVAKGHGIATGTNSPVTVTIDSTGADFGSVGFSHNGVVQTFSVTDNKGNTWTQRAVSTGGNPPCEMWDTQGGTFGSNHQITVTRATGSDPIYMTACAASFSGSGSNPYDTQAGTGSVLGNNTSCSPGAITPATTNELLMIFVGLSSGATGVAIDTGFTITDGNDGGTFGVNFGGTMAYLIDAAATSINPTWTWTGGASFNTLIVSYYGAVGASGIGVLAFGPHAINGDALFLTPTGPANLAFGPLGMGSSAALDEGLPLGRLRQFWTL